MIVTTSRWEFLSEGGGIAFRIYCKTCSGENIEILPFSRVESHLFMEEGEMICELIGSCRLMITFFFLIIKHCNLKVLVLNFY